LRINHRRKQAHATFVRLGRAHEIDGCRLTHCQNRQVLFGDLAAHFDLTAAGQPEQRLSAGAGCLSNFGMPCERGAIGWRHDTSAREARLCFSQHGFRDFDIGRISH